MQRQKNFRDYQDLESNFEKRPSLWAEPIGDWGEGSVQLIEIPTKEEIHDNIAGFWRPKNPLQAKGEHTYTYRLHWGPDTPKPTSLARFSRTGVGAKRRRHQDIRARSDRRQAEVGRSQEHTRQRHRGKSRDQEHRHPAKPGDRRLAVELRAFASRRRSPVELRASLMQGNDAISEVWVYRWTP